MSDRVTRSHSQANEPTSSASSVSGHSSGSTSAPPPRGRPKGKKSKSPKASVVPPAEDQALAEIRAAWQVAKRTAQVHTSVYSAHSLALVEGDLELLSGLRLKLAAFADEAEILDAYYNTINELIERKAELMAAKPSEQAVSGVVVSRDSERAAGAEPLVKSTELPAKFSGNVLDWPRYWSSFQRVMRRYPLKPASQFHYLCESVSSDVLASISHLPPERDDSLDRAIAILRTSYEYGVEVRKSLEQHIDKLPKYSKRAPADAWQKMSTICNGIVERVEFDESDKRALRVQIMKWMPGDDKDEFEKKYLTPKGWTLQDLAAFIENRVSLERNRERDETFGSFRNSQNQPQAGSAPAASRFPPPAEARDGNRRSKPAKRLQHGRTFATIGLASKCALCGGRHEPVHCTLELARRHAVCKAGRLCYRCLQPYSPSHKLSCRQNCASCVASGRTGFAVGHHVALCRNSNQTSTRAAAPPAPVVNSPQSQA